MNPKNEEEVKIKIVIPWLESLGYKIDCMEFEKTIPIQEGTKKKNIFADIVIYTNKRKDTPIIVVDTKAPNEVLDRTDKEQVISYARLLPKIAPLAVLTNGYGYQIYKTLDKSRIKELPKRSILLTDFFKLIVSSGIEHSLREEAKKQLFIVEDVGTFKMLLSHCHNDIRNNEGYDPVKAFDELSKVLFTKMYEEKYNGEKTRFTINIFKETQEKLGINIVQQIFKDVQSIPEYSNLFDSDLKIDLQDRTIESIVSTFEKYDLTLTRFDIKGEAFEHFLGDTFTGGLGQFFTPRNVVEFIVDAISPKIGDKIIDPFCGTGGFLIYAFEVVSDKIHINEFSETEKEKWKLKLSNESLFGTDWIERTAQACKMNMIVHGDGNTGVYKHDGLANIKDIIEENFFDLCLTNPPFGSIETNQNILNNYELGQGRKSQERKILALERALRLVHPGGIIGIVIDDGVLNNDTLGYVREFLNREAEILCVVGLNKETFQGYGAQAKTSILIMKRKIELLPFQPYDIFMAVCDNSGYSTTGLPIAGNELPDILFDYKKYIVSNDIDFIHKRCKIISIDNPSIRLDANSYIPSIYEIKSLPTINIALNLSSNIENIRQTILTLEQSISEYSTFGNYDEMKMSEILEYHSNWVPIIPNNRYSLLGIHGKGEGLFIRESKFGHDIKALKLNQLKKDWFVYSRLFARNGSFAMVNEEFIDGCVSNEFPTFKVKEIGYTSSHLLSYLILYLNSPHILAWIESQCTGQAKVSRARFKENRFLKLMIPMPHNNDILKMANDILELKNSIKRLLNKSNDLKESTYSFFPQI